MKEVRSIIILAIFATLLTLYGCSGLEKKGDQGSTGTFKDRTSQKMLTEQIIDTTSDENLLWTVFESLSEKLPADYAKEYESVLSWNKSRQAIYMIWLLEGEVNNGGYNQFYYNSSGQFYKHLPDALRLVGAYKFADLTQKANDTYEKENEKITKHLDGTSEGFSKSYENNPLNDFDTKFYNLEEDLQQIQINYIKKNKKDFIDK